MDDSFDERSETDINDCSEDISEGEEDDLLDLGSDMIMKVILYTVCSLTNWVQCCSIIWVCDKPVAVKWLKHSDIHIWKQKKKMKSSY